MTADSTQEAVQSQQDSILTHIIIHQELSKNIQLRYLCFSTTQKP